MVSLVDVLISAMFLSNNIWSVYGILVDSEGNCMSCASIPTTSVQTSNWSAITIVPSSTFQPLSRLKDSTHQSEVPVDASSITTSRAATHFVSSANYLVPSTSSAASSTPPAPPAKQTRRLSSGEKIGIGVAVGVLASALAFIAIFDACCLRRKRRERAMLNAIEEIERGTDKGSEERIVLESRVSIVFDDEGSLEEERGRQGMSLPRRE